MVDFIGVGAQKAGTSWIYANLYEHPEICAPIKELHFFSRPRFEKGQKWYESHFTRCNEGLKKGEFSTSYLYSKEAPKRIHEYYPDVKLIAVLRNPIDRAYSQYTNALKTGEIDASMSFEEYTKNEQSALEQGRYAEQLERYFTYFTHSHVLVLIYEDIEKDPAAFMSRIYAFLGVESSFRSSMLEQHINVARMPKRIWLEKVMHHVAETLRRVGLDRMVHRVRQLGFPEKVRALNTKNNEEAAKEQFERTTYTAYFSEDVRALSKMLKRDLGKEWNIS